MTLKEDYSNNYSHAERLHLYIDEILRENNLKPGDLDAIAISKGPGSYTGLRIGVSAAKGLCFSLDIPLIAVPTLESLAHQVTENSVATIVPMLDARRMEVYTAGFTADKESVFETRAQVLDASSYKDLLESGRTVFIGSGVKKFQEICDHKNAVFIEDKLPSAEQMVPLSQIRFSNSSFEDVAYFEPFYLKDFIAG